MAIVEFHPSGFRLGSFPANLLEFMYGQRLGLLEMAAAADVLAADCRFNSWVVQTVKKLNLSEEFWLDLVERNQATIDLAESAIHKSTLRRVACDYKSSTRDHELIATFDEVARLLNDRSLPAAI